MIARCTATAPEARYQSVEEILTDINRRQHYSRYAAAILAIVAVSAVGIALLTHRENETPEINEPPGDSVVQMHRDSIVQEDYGERSLVNQERVGVRSLDSVRQNHAPAPKILPQPTDKDIQAQLKEDLDKMIDQAYRSTIATFCDSIFPSITVGRQWEKQSSEFHAQALQVAAELSEKYPDIPESVIIQHVESRLQNLTGYVFNRMRANGDN